MFHFAWVDKTDDVFGAQHHIEDEQVFGFRLVHDEGQYPALELDIRNPRVGLLTPARKQWAWLSWRRGPGDVVPLFFGRLIGVPQALQANLVTLHFVARPHNVEDQKAALAEALRELPWWDPVWLNPDEREDPDKVLEGRAALWHYDRVSHQVTVSGIVSGEDGTELFGADEVLYDSVTVSHSVSPARRAVVEASVTWDQAGAGTIDVTPRLVQAFGTVTPPQISMIDGEPRVTAGLVVIACGEELLRAWPEEGRRIGGGWSVGESLIGVAGPEPTTLVLHTESDFLAVAQQVAAGDPVLAATFGRTPGLAVPIEPSVSSAVLGLLPFGVFVPERTVLWIPVWRFVASLAARFDAARSRTETVRFSIAADVQPLLSDPGEEEVIRLDFGPAPVDEDLDETTEGVEVAIGDVRRASYFRTARGRHSLAHLMARARAALLARARAVDVSFEVPFGLGVGLSCRKSAAIVDPRLPGGQAAGKIKGYTLSADGRSGRTICAVTIGCTVGRDGAVEVEAGAPTWAEEGYVAEGYQVYEGAVTVPLAGDVGYEDFTQLPIDDDGVDLAHVTAAEYIEELTVEGGMTIEQEEIERIQTGVFVNVQKPHTWVEVVDVLSAVHTTVSLRLKPVSGGPFATVLEPVMTELKVPRTIDLEAV